MKSDFTPNIDKEFRLKEFINEIICDQLKRLIYGAKDVSPYSKFLVLPQYIEFLGACTDDKPFVKDLESKTRFNNVLKNYFKKVNRKYETYSNGNDTQWDLYEHFRCGVVHQLRPLKKVVFTTREEARKAENVHLEKDKEHDEFLVLVLEDLYDDIEKVAKAIISDFDTKKFTTKINTKWNEKHIAVIDDGGIED